MGVLEKRLLNNISGQMEGEDAEGRRKELIFFLSPNTKVKGSRYRPGLAQIVGRGIDLLLNDRGTRRG